MHIDDIMSFSKSIKPIDGEFSQKPQNYRTIKQWLDYGYKVKETSIVNGGEYFAMQNVMKGFKYFSKDEVEPMSNDEKEYYEMKYKGKVWTPRKASTPQTTSKTYPSNKVMGATKNNTPLQKTNTNSFSKKNDVSLFRIPYNPKMLDDKIMLFINVETTGEGGKGRPKYGDEILNLSIIRANLKTGEYTIMYDDFFKPKNHISWKESEFFHKITPKDVENCSTFEKNKEQIKQCLKFGDIVVSYGDNNFDILEEVGIYIDKNARFDTKEMFVKHHPELKSFSFSKFMEVYCNEKTASIYKNTKNNSDKHLSFLKNLANVVASSAQYKTICSELKQLQDLQVKSNKDVEEFER